MKKKRKTEGESYKRKSTIGGWILFAIVVGVLVVYLRREPETEADLAMKNPDDALAHFADVAYNVSHFQTGSGPARSTIDELLDLCLEEDKEWFQDNYDAIYERNEASFTGANPNYMVKRNVAMKIVLENGLNRRDYEILEKDPGSASVQYKLEIPGPYDTSRIINVKLKRVKRQWKMCDLGGGKRFAL